MNNSLKHVCSECVDVINGKKNYLSRSETSEEAPKSDYFDFEKEKGYMKYYELHLEKTFKKFLTTMKSRFYSKKFLKYFKKKDEDFSEEEWQTIIDVISVSAIIEVLKNRNTGVARRTYGGVIDSMVSIHGKSPISRKIPSSIKGTVNRKAKSLAENKKIQIDSKLGMMVSYGKSKNMSNKVIMGGIEKYFKKLSGYESKRIARTETVDCANLAALNVYEKYGIELLAIKTQQNACPICLSLASNNPYEFDNCPLPTFHPLCGCFIEPVF